MLSNYGLSGTKDNAKYWNDLLPQELKIARPTGHTPRHTIGHQQAAAGATVQQIMATTHHKDLKSLKRYAKTSIKERTAGQTLFNTALENFQYRDIIAGVDTRPTAFKEPREVDEVAEEVQVSKKQRDDAFSIPHFTVDKTPEQVALEKNPNRSVLEQTKPPSGNVYYINFH